MENGDYGAFMFTAFYLSKTRLLAHEFSLLVATYAYKA
jgi:hypothetical protein